MTLRPYPRKGGSSEHRRASASNFLCLSRGGAERVDAVKRAPRKVEQLAFSGMIDRLATDNMQGELRVATVEVAGELCLRRSRADNEDLFDGSHIGDDVLKELVINGSPAIAADPSLEVKLALYRMTLNDARLSAKTR